MTDADRGQVGASAAEVYEHFFVPALFGQWGPVMADAAGLRRGQRVLDVGCGTGVAARAAAERVGPGGTVVGLDVNEAMLAVARRCADRVTWRRGAAESLPFDDASFDRVLCQFAVMFFDDRHRAVAEMARVLVPGGALALATWAALEESPGYAAMVDLLHGLFGDAAASALRAPFGLGDPTTLADLIAPVFGDVRVTRHEGVARFATIDAWVHTDVHGWTLAGLLDEAGYARLLDAAHRELGRFALPDGSVSFPAPALVATATRTVS